MSQGRRKSEDATPVPPSPPALDALRRQIDQIDERLVAMLNERARLVVEVGKVKREGNVPIYAPHREAAVLERVLRLSAGPLPASAIEAVYRELMSGSFHLEQPQRIGYVGPPGSFAHAAAIRHFGCSVAYEDMHAIAGVFTEVARQHVDYGLVPIENSMGGGGAETMDAFTQYHADVHVYAEIQLTVQRCLLANCPPPDVRRIYASPESYSQCRNWLATQYPQAAIITAPSSAEAARLARAEAEQGRAGDVAAIGSELAGEMYGLHVLFQHIDDRPNEIMRFLVISRGKTKPSGDDKTSIMFTTADRPGALVDVLTVFQKASVNLTHIDKRPSGRVNWEYTFFIDAVGHTDDTAFAAVLEEARRHCKELTVLGSYPRSRRPL
jgi:chorismate mutase/prephenate dehydratase